MNFPIFVVGDNISALEERCRWIAEVELNLLQSREGAHF